MEKLQQTTSKIKIWVDNKSVYYTATGRGFDDMQRIKHLVRGILWCRDAVRKMGSQLSIDHVVSHKNCADILTKVKKGADFTKGRDNLGLTSLEPITEQSIDVWKEMTLAQNSAEKPNKRLAMNIETEREYQHYLRNITHT